jgi:hypothetical protein
MDGRIPTSNRDHDLRVAALDHLGGLEQSSEQSHGLLRRDLEIVDLRQEDRLIVRLNPEAEQPVPVATPVKKALAASRRMSSAATTISTPSSTAEKYSALWCPKGWLSSAGMWETRIAYQATAEATTLTMDSIASESSATEPVSHQAENFSARIARPTMMDQKDRRRTRAAWGMADKNAIG